MAPGPAVPASLLILTRFPGEGVWCDAGGVRVYVKVLGVRDGKVKLGFGAPASVKILREELQCLKP